MNRLSALSHILVLVMGLGLGYWFRGTEEHIPISSSDDKNLPVHNKTAEWIHKNPVVSDIVAIEETSLTSTMDAKRFELLERASSKVSNINDVIEELETWLLQYPESLDVLDAYISLVWNTGDYDKIFSYSYSTLSVLSGYLYQQRRSDIHRLSLEAEKNLLQAELQYKLVPLYQYLTQLEPEYLPYYLKLTHWAIESKQLSLASETLEYMSSDTTYLNETQKLRTRLSNALVSQERILIPLEKKRRHFFIDVTLNDQVNAHLLIDTGASLTVIKPNVARALGIDYEFEGEILSLQTANGRAEGYKVGVSSLSLGELVLGPLELVVLDLGDLRADGLLGMDALSHYQFFINQQEEHLVIIP